MTTISNDHANTVLLVGASRGLGAAMAAAFLQRGWHVVGTVRGDARTELHALAEMDPGRVTIEQLDITEPDQIAVLREHLDARRLDMLFVNAGTANRNQGETVAETTTDEFIRVMVTNALGVMRAVEGLQHLVRPDGTIGVMSSGQGSIGNNTNGKHDVYRGSKAALNQYMRGYAARQADGRRAIVLMAPGWIRTALGGPNAPLAIEDSVPHVVDVLIAQEGQPGLRYLDRHGNTVPW